MSLGIRIVMADDHEIFRDGFAVMFQNTNTIELVDQVSNGAFLVASVTKNLPDVVVTDIQMPTMDGIEATRIIRSKFPHIPVIAMTMFDDNYSIIEMLKAGATGYIGKNSGKQVVFEAIRAVYAGENYYCRSTSEKLSALISSGRFDPTNLETLDFSPIELRVISYICQDMETKEIAEKLSINWTTIKKIRMEILDKAGVGSTAGLIMFAVRSGIYKL